MTSSWPGGTAGSRSAARRTAPDQAWRADPTEPSRPRDPEQVCSPLPRRPVRPEVVGFRGRPSEQLDGQRLDFGPGQRVVLVAPSVTGQSHSFDVTLDRGRCATEDPRRLVQRHGVDRQRHGSTPSTGRPPLVAAIRGMWIEIPTELARRQALPRTPTGVSMPDGPHVPRLGGTPLGQSASCSRTPSVVHLLIVLTVIIDQPWNMQRAVGEGSRR